MPKPMMINQPPREATRAAFVEYLAASHPEGERAGYGDELNDEHRAGVEYQRDAKRVCGERTRYGEHRLDAVVEHTGTRPDTRARP